MTGSVALLWEVNVSNSLSRRASFGGSTVGTSDALGMAVGVIRDDPFERLTKRDGGSVIAVDAESTFDVEVKIDVVSDDVLDDRLLESCEVSVLDARSRIGGFRRVVSDEGTLSQSGYLRESTLSLLECLFWASLRTLEGL